MTKALFFMLLFTTTQTWAMNLDTTITHCLGLKCLKNNFVQKDGCYSPMAITIKNYWLKKGEKVSCKNSDLVLTKTKPHIVNVVSMNKIICGGALIASDVVITNASCLENIFNAQVIAGGTYNDPNMQIQSVAQLTIHENFNSMTRANDIATLKLAAPFNLSEAIYPIPFSNSNLSYTCALKMKSDVVLFLKNLNQMQVAQKLIGTVESNLTNSIEEVKCLDGLSISPYYDWIMVNSI
jgi:hypothetical protein